MNGSTEHRRLLQLWLASCDGEVSPGELAELKLALGSDRELRQLVASVAQDVSVMERYLAGGAKSNGSDRPQRAVPTSTADKSRGRQHLATAACVLAALLLGVFVGRSTGPSIGNPEVAMVIEGGANPDAPAVRLTEALHCVWSESSQYWPSETVLQKGGSVELLEGFAKFDVSSADWQATLQIEGPAAVMITSEGLPALRYGKMLVNLSDQTAIDSVAIELPYARICVTPGTELGVGAFGSVCETHVFQGVANLELLWQADLEAVNSLWSSDQRIEAGTSLVYEVADGTVRNVQQGAANRGVFDTKAFMQGGPLVIAQPYVEEVMQSAPVAYWRFEDATDGVVQNEMQDQYHLHVHGGVTVTGLAGNRYAYFSPDEPANGPRFLATEEPISSALLADYCIEMWVNPSHYQTSTLTGVMVPEKRIPRRPSDFKHGLLIELGGFSGGSRLMRPKKIRYLHRSLDPDVDGASLFTDSSYAVRQWQHIVCNRVGELAQVYVNGVKVGEDECATPLEGGQIAVVGQLANTRVERCFCGKIDELAIYNHALPPEEIQSHFAAAEAFHSDSPTPTSRIDRN